MGTVKHRWLSAEPGSSLESVLRQCPDFMADQEQPLESLRLGIWGRVRPLSTPLRDRDRIEAYRPLTVDPKEARRQRHARRGGRIVSRHRPKAGA